MHHLRCAPFVCSQVRQPAASKTCSIMYSPKGTDDEQANPSVKEKANKRKATDAPAAKATNLDDDSSDESDDSASFLRVKA
eukprot:559-Pleurochrysis_carterae.AAC.1